MVELTINGSVIKAEEGTSILDAAEAANISIPHLCYLKEINEIGACRLCSVEVEGEPKLVPACTTTVREGMKVTTNSARVRSACRTNLGLIMSQHDGKCSMCVRSGNCKLQELANDFNITEGPYIEDLPKGKQTEWNMNFPLIRDAKKCIKCMRCIQVCDKIQGMHVWDLMATGGRTRVDVSGNRSIEEADCALCGQCITHCPVVALRERDDVEKVWYAIEHPDVVTVVQIAPAVRTAWGEALGLSPEEATVNRLAGVLKKLGFDYVFDTTFSADLTIMEEANEFLVRFGNKELEEYPMFTSCCPGWIRFIKSKYPELVPQLSTAKSPQQMFGAVTKSYFAKKIGVEPSKICCVSIMPCVAKKSECDLPSMKDKNGVKDVDFVLTTREVVRLMKIGSVQADKTEECAFDSILGDYTGAGVIFGATGGVMEAALRTAYYKVMGVNPPMDAFHEVRAGGGDISKVRKPWLEPEKELSSARPWREATFNLNGTELHIAVTSGLANTDKLCRAIVEHKVKYDFVEIMACPGGCSGGGGQPIHTDDVERANTRGTVLYNIDDNMKVRFSHENQDVIKLYEEELGEPLSELAEELLHVSHLS